MSLFFLRFWRSSFCSQGSHNIAYLGLEDKDKLVNGGFYRDGKIEEKENSKLDSMSDVGDELWKLSEKLSGLKWEHSRIIGVSLHWVSCHIFSFAFRFKYNVVHYYHIVIEKEIKKSLYLRVLTFLTSFLNSVQVPLLKLRVYCHITFFCVLLKTFFGWVFQVEIDSSKHKPKWFV